MTIHTDKGKEKSTLMAVTRTITIPTLIRTCLGKIIITRIRGLVPNEMAPAP